MPSFFYLSAYSRNGGVRMSFYTMNRDDEPKIERVVRFNTGKTVVIQKPKPLPKKEKDLK